MKYVHEQEDLWLLKCQWNQSDPTDSKQFLSKFQQPFSQKWESQSSNSCGIAKIAKPILKNNKVGGLTLLNFETYCIITVIKACGTDKWTDTQTNGIE